MQEKIKLIITEFQELCIEKENQEENKFLKELSSFLDSGHYNISVIGESKRGKSTFINKLLETDILEESSIPTAQINIRVIGTKNETEFVSFCETKEKKELKDFDWDFINKSDKKLLFSIDNNWLNMSNIALTEVVSINNLEDINTDPYREMKCADATLLVMSATMAFSSTEKEILDLLVNEYRITNIGIVLTHLELISKEKVNEVLGYIREKTDAISKDIFIFATIDKEFAPNQPSTPDFQAVKSRVNEWAGNNQKQLLRDIYVANQLYLLSESMIKQLVEENKLFDNKVEEKIKKDQSLYNFFETKKSIWEDLKIETERRSINCISKLKDDVDMFNISMSEKLRFELSQSTNPKEWWKNVLPYRLKTELQNFSVNYEKQLERLVMSDVTWLNTQIKKIYAKALQEVKYDTGNLTPNADIIPGADQLKDLNKIRTISRCATGGASIATYFLFGPLGMLASIGGGIISEKYLSDNIYKQKQALSEALDNVINSTFVKLLNEIKYRVDNFYNSALDKTKEVESEWIVKQEELIKQHDIVENKEQVRNRKFISKLFNIQETIKNV